MTLSLSPLVSSSRRFSAGLGHQTSSLPAPALPTVGAEATAATYPRLTDGLPPRWSAPVGASAPVRGTSARVPRSFIDPAPASALVVGLAMALMLGQLLTSVAVIFDGDIGRSDVQLMAGLQITPIAVAALVLVTLALTTSVIRAAESE